MAAKFTRLTQNSDTIAPSGRELYHLQFSLCAASPETYGYNNSEIWYEGNREERTFAEIRTLRPLAGCIWLGQKISI